MDHNEIFEHDGYHFRFKLEEDVDMGAPWEEHDGHGPVRTVQYLSGRQIDKKPGERVLWENGSRHNVYLYDWQGAIALAKKDGWGVPAGLRENLTPGRIAELAVQADFDRLRGYLNEHWSWVGVVVQMLDDEGDVVETNSLWGIESDSPEYHDQVARELASDLVVPLLLAAQKLEEEREMNLAEVD
jgi:hypothetical protein